MTHLGGAYGQGKPYVALTSDDHLHGSSYSIAVLEWTVVPGPARRSAVPLVSVVMPVYNSAATLSAAVRSVLTQTHSDLELLVTDEQSSDGSISYFKMDADYDGESTGWVPNGRVIRAREYVDYRAMLVQDHIGALTAMCTTEMSSARG